MSALDPTTALRHADAQAQRILETVNVALPSSVNRRVLTLTSAVAGEGVSTVTWTLAKALARDPSNRVLYVDANPEAPVSARLIAESPNEGLLSFLLGRCNLEDTVRPARGFAAISVLASTPAEGVHAGSIMDVQVEKGLGLLRASFNYVLVDAAPPSVSPFTLLLARHSDGVILVTESGATPRDLVAGAVDQIRGSAQRFLGVALNRRA
jgi:Mrp family chromosome partitioning ATPase